MDNYHLLAQASGCRIYKINNLIVVKKEPAMWISTAIFVFVLLAVIPFLVGMILLVNSFVNSIDLLSASVLLLGIGSFCGLILGFLIQYKRKVKHTSPEALNTICSFNLKRNELLDGTDVVLSDLDHVTIERKFQVTSSSKKLVVKWENGALTLAEGNPFSGGIAPLERALRSVGLMN